MADKQIKAVSFEVENTKALAAQINKFGKEGRQVMRYTISDVKKQAPNIVMNNILSTYNLERKDFKNKNVVVTKVKVEKKSDAMDVGIIYTGRLLTARHFSMTPKKPPAMKKLGKKEQYQIQRPNGSYMTITKRRPPYELSFEIFKGKRTTLKPKGSTRYYLQHPKNHSQMLPWRVHGEDKPEVIKTLSVPQMLGNKTVSKGFMKELNKKLTERFNHHFNRIIKK